MPHGDRRAHAYSLMEWTVRENKLIDYPENDVRPMTTNRLSEAELEAKFAAGEHIVCDCSEFVCLIMRLAGFRDPCGLGYDGYGGSSTMWTHLPHYIEPKAALTSSILVIGAGGSVHACLVANADPAGGNPRLCSNGSEAGPIFVDFKDEIAAHPGQPWVFLKIGLL